MAENWTIKSVDGVEPKSAQETEQAVVEAAAETQDNVEIVKDNDVIKVNLDEPVKQEENEQQVSDEQPSTEVEQVSEPEGSEEAESPLELVTEEEPKEESVEEPVEASAKTVDAIQEAAEDPKIELPENVDKLVKFMEETGGTVEDYVNLNKDLSDYDDNALLREYYKQAKPSWDDQDIRDHMDDQFSYDEELDDNRDVRSKKRAFKDELYNAKRYLEGNRDKYYADLVSKKENNIAPEYKEAFEFHSSYKETLKKNEQLTQSFQQRTADVFNDDFKGFDFKVGDNTYRYKVAEPSKTKEYQSDINNFVKEFLGEDGSIKDAKGYHKAMFTAKNADKLAQHFYEQGRAEALKQSAAEAKNINMDPRKDKSSEIVTKSGTKVRVVNTSSSGLKFKNYKK